jgi:hypothetical protein
VTVTASATPTFTAVPNSTNTPSSTFTNTPTSTPTNTSTSTSTPTNTPNSCTFNVSTVAQLISSITSANSTPALDIICVQAGTYSLTAINNGLNGLPSISTPIQIISVGGSVTIQRGSGAPDMRFFNIQSNGDLTLQGITLNNGSLRNDTAGAVYNAGHFTITNGAITNTTARNAGAIYSTGQLSFNNTSMSNDVAIEKVGAIQVISGGLSINGGTFSSNNARWGSFRSTEMPP